LIKKREKERRKRENSVEQEVFSSCVYIILQALADFLNNP